MIVYIILVTTKVTQNVTNRSKLIAWLKEIHTLLANRSYDTYHRFQTPHRNRTR